MNLYNIERPRTRGDCAPGGPLHMRPCPFVACRHHLLIEAGSASRGAGDDLRPQSIRLNRAHLVGKFGRRSGLRADAPDSAVGSWIDDALEHLATMEHTCALDVSDANPDGMQLADIGRALGVTCEAIRSELQPAAAKLREGLAEYEDHVPQDHSSALARMAGA